MSLRASLAPRRAPTPPMAGPAPWLDPNGARVILGRAAGTGPAVAPLAPAADTLFAPRGACLAGPDGPLVVCDTGHHRLLIWTRTPAHDATPADLLIGQPDFTREGRNAGGPAGAATLNVPTGVAFDGGVLAVADAWNHRVLIWHGLPLRSNRPADVVLGQADFAATQPNRGADRPRADTLNWCYGVSLRDGRLIVCDTGNRRVLLWDRVPTATGAPADLVLGQPDFAARDLAADGMRWPHAAALWGESLAIADAGTHRVLIWHAWPARHGAPCDRALGDGVSRAGTASLNMPYGVAWPDRGLAVADTANSRLVGFDPESDRAAHHLAGQASFADSGDNRWDAPARDSLCWPYGLAAAGDTLVVADSGNNRVLLWDMA